MPRQLIHEGRSFSLVPMQSSSEDTRTPREITTAARQSGDWSSHFYEPGPNHVGAVGDGVVLSQEPTISLTWSKGTHDNSGGPNDQGHVMFEMEFDEGFLERVMAGRRLMRENVKDPSLDAPVPMKVLLHTGSLSWRDLNVLAKTARDARDGAFGKPE